MSPDEPAISQRDGAGGPGGRGRDHSEPRPVCARRPAPADERHHHAREPDRRNAEGDIEKTVAQIATTAAHASQLVNEITPQIKAIAQNGNRISAGTQQIVAKLRAGEGTIGKLINDGTLYERAREIADQTKTVMASVRQVTDEGARQSPISVRRVDPRRGSSPICASRSARRARRRRISPKTWRR